MSIIVEEITELDKITEIALGLTLSERAQLLEVLQYSLLTEQERAVEDAWLKEIERRVAEVDSGEVETF
ncbi:MAG: addiction module protein, partial [Pyrinomonadaceae bacterium]